MATAENGNHKGWSLEDDEDDEVAEEEGKGDGEGECGRCGMWGRVVING